MRKKIRIFQPKLSWLAIPFAIIFIAYFVVPLILTLIVSFFLGENSTGGAVIDYSANKITIKAFASEFLKTFYGYESVFTRFYQGYLLPKKFKIDKRILHLSTLIVTKQISREDALKEISKSPYPNEIEMKEDIEYFLKKSFSFFGASFKGHLIFRNSLIIFELIFPVLVNLGS